MLMPRENVEDLRRPSVSFAGEPSGCSPGLVAVREGLHRPTRLPSIAVEAYPTFAEDVMLTSFLHSSPQPQSASETDEARTQRILREGALLDAAYAKALGGDAMDHAEFDAWCDEIIAGIPK